MISSSIVQMRKENYCYLLFSQTGKFEVFPFLAWLVNSGELFLKVIFLHFPQCWCFIWRKIISNCPTNQWCIWFSGDQQMLPSEIWFTVRLCVSLGVNKPRLTVEVNNGLFIAHFSIQISSYSSSDGRTAVLIQGSSRFVSLCFSQMRPGLVFLTFTRYPPHHHSLLSNTRTCQK